MKKIITILLVLMMMFTMVACQNNSNKLVMATNAEFPPYEFKENNEFKGIDVEIANEIAKKLGKELQILDIQFDAIINSVDSGKADMGMAGMTVTEDRKQNVDFSNTYTSAVQSIIVKNNSNFNKSSDLNNSTIGVQTGTTGDLYCTDDFGEENVKRYNKAADAVQALLAGSIDCVVVDDQVAISLIESNEGLKLLPTSYKLEEYAICVKKGNSELLDQINTALEELTNEGKIDEIKNKYLK